MININAMQLGAFVSSREMKKVSTRRFSLKISLLCESEKCENFSAKPKCKVEFPDYSSRRLIMSKLN